MHQLHYIKKIFLEEHTPKLMIIHSGIPLPRSDNSRVCNHNTMHANVPTRGNFPLHPAESVRTLKNIKPYLDDSQN